MAGINLQLCIICHESGGLVLQPWQDSYKKLLDIVHVHVELQDCGEIHLSGKNTSFRKRQDQQL